MCVHDPAAKEAAVSRFLRENPQTSDVGHDHLALRGIDAVLWSELPHCPAAMPALFNGLIDEATCREALRVLGIVLTDGIFHLSPAMPLALPFLIELAGDRHVPARIGLMELLAVTAELSLPIGNDEQGGALLFGTDDAHPERAKCRTVFAEHADTLRSLLADDALPEELRSPDVQSALLTAIAAP
jgi:hypothetical protein